MRSMKARVADEDASTDGGFLSQETLEDRDVGESFVFTTQFMQRLLRNKHVVFFGDSVMRGIYKDFICLLQCNTLVSNMALKQKGELRFMQDTLCWRTARTNGIEFEEVREFATPAHLVQFYFITRCYNEVMERALAQMQVEPPDIVIINSCLWDITRYASTEKEAVIEYRNRLTLLMERLRMVLPATGRCIWLTTPPLASAIGAGFLQANINFMQEALRIVVLEANLAAAQVVAAYGGEVFDVNCYMRTGAVLRHRVHDGVHWKPPAHRHITDMILAFLMDGWGIAMPAEFAEKFAKIGWKADLDHLRIESFSSMAKPLLAMIDVASAFVGDGHLTDLQERSSCEHEDDNGRSRREREVRYRHNGDRHRVRSPDRHKSCSRSPLDSETSSNATNP